MPRHRRIPKTRTREMGYLEGWELLIGPGGRSAFASDAARRAAWQAHREEILKRWEHGYPGMRPSAWWRYDAPEPRLENERDAEALERLGLLSDEERGRVAARGQGRQIASTQPDDAEK